MKQIRIMTAKFRPWACKKKRADLSEKTAPKGTGVFPNRKYPPSKILVLNKKGM